MTERREDFEEGMELTGDIPVTILFQKSGSPEPMENAFDFAEGRSSAGGDEDNSPQLISASPSPPNYDYMKGFAQSESFIVQNTILKKSEILKAKEDVLLARQQTTKLGKWKTPLELGWRRETKVEESKAAQIQRYGKVVYLSPTGAEFSLREQLELHLKSQDNSNPYGFTGENFSFAAKHRIANTAEDFITTFKSPVKNVEASPNGIKRSTRKRTPKATLEDDYEYEHKAKKRTKGTSQFVSGMLHPKYPTDLGTATTLSPWKVERSSTGNAPRAALDEFPHGGLFQISELYKENPCLALLYSSGDEFLKAVSDVCENAVALEKNDELISKQAAPQPSSSPPVLQTETEKGKEINAPRSLLIPKYVGRGSGGPCGYRCLEAGGRYPDLECVGCRSVYHSICLGNVVAQVNRNGFLCLKCEAMAKKPVPPKVHVSENPTFVHPDQLLLPHGLQLGKGTSISRISSTQPFITQHWHPTPMNSSLPHFEALCRPKNWSEEKIVQLPLKVYAKPGSKIAKDEQNEKSMRMDDFAQYPNITVIPCGKMPQTSNTTRGSYRISSQPAFYKYPPPNVHMTTFGQSNYGLQHENSSGCFIVNTLPKIPTLSGEKFKNHAEINLRDPSKMLGSPKLPSPPPDLFPIGYGSNVSLGEANNRTEFQLKHLIRMNSSSRPPNQEGNSTQVFKKGESPIRQHSFAVPVIPPPPLRTFSEIANRIYPVEAAGKKVDGYWNDDDDVIQID